MVNNFKRFLVILLITIYQLPVTSGTEIPSDLKTAINEKTQALQEINQKILQTEKELDETEDKSRTLQTEIKRRNQQLQQLNLSVRATEINIDKLNLEIKTLDADIGEAQSEIKIQKSGLSQIIKAIDRKDRENTLEVLLRHQSLSESLSELENLLGLNASLADNIEGLQILENNLAGKLNLTSEKRGKVKLENKNLKSRQLIVTGQKTEKQNLLSQTKNQERLYENQLKDLKKLQAEVSAEVEKIEAELRAKIDPALLPIPRPSVLAWPVVLKENGGFGRITQKFGIASYLYGGRPHNGIDVGAPIGTPVFAAEKGRVLESWNQDRYCYKGAYGKFIVIEHENNLTTLYAHLSLQAVKKDDAVNRGDLIGYVGSTGYATGPHLHFTLYASQTFISRPSKVNCGPIMPFGGTLDPQKYL